MLKLSGKGKILRDHKWFLLFLIFFVVGMGGMAVHSMAVRYLISVFPVREGEKPSEGNSMRDDGSFSGSWRGTGVVRLKEEIHPIWVTQQVPLSSRKNPQENGNGWNRAGDQIRWFPPTGHDLYQRSGEFRVPLSLLEEKKLFFNGEAEELWVDYEDLFPPNPVQMGIELLLKGGKKSSWGGKRDYFFGGTPVAGEKREINIGSKEWIQKGIGYRLRKYSNRKPLDSWNYSLDDKTVVLQNRLHERITDCSKIQLFFEPHTPIREIGARISRRDNFGLGQRIKIWQPSNEMLDNGVADIDIQLFVRDVLRGRSVPLKNESYLQELVIYVGGAEEEFIKNKPIHQLVFTYDPPALPSISGMRVETLPSHIEYFPSGQKRVVVDIRSLHHEYFGLEVGASNIVMTPKDLNKISSVQVKGVRFSRVEKKSIPVYFRAGAASSRRWGGPFLNVAEEPEQCEWPLLQAYFPFNVMSVNSRSQKGYPSEEETAGLARWDVTSRLVLSTVPVSSTGGSKRDPPGISVFKLFSYWKKDLESPRPLITLQSLVSVSTTTGSYDLSDSLKSPWGEVVLTPGEKNTCSLQSKGTRSRFFSQNGATFFPETTLTSVANETDGFSLIGVGEWVDVEVPIAGRVESDSRMFLGMGEGADRVRRIQAKLFFIDGKMMTIWPHPNEVLTLGGKGGVLKRVNLHIEFTKNPFDIKLTELAFFKSRLLPPDQAFKEGLLKDISEPLFPEGIVGFPQGNVDLDLDVLRAALSKSLTNSRDLKWSTRVVRPVKWIRGISLLYQVPGGIPRHRIAWLEMILNFEHHRLSREIELEQSSGDLFLPWGEIVNSPVDISDWGDLKTIDWRVRINDGLSESHDLGFQFSAKINGRALRSMSNELEDWKVAFIGESGHGMTFSNNFPPENISQIIQRGGRIPLMLDGETTNRIVSSNGHLIPIPHPYFELDTVLLEPTEPWSMDPLPLKPERKEAGTWNKRSLVFVFCLLGVWGGALWIRKCSLRNWCSGKIGLAKSLIEKILKGMNRLAPFLKGIQRNATRIWWVAALTLSSVGVWKFFEKGENGYLNSGTLALVWALNLGSKSIQRSIRKRWSPFPEMVDGSSEDILLVWALVFLLGTFLSVSMEFHLLREYFARMTYFSLSLSVFSKMWFLLFPKTEEKTIESIKNRTQK